MMRPTTKIDVFSFGIIVMEFMTKRRPTAEIEDNGEELALQDYVGNAVGGGVQSVVSILDSDMNLATEIEVEKVVGVLELALSCVRPAAGDRPNMNEVLASLLKLNKD